MALVGSEWPHLRDDFSARPLCRTSRQQREEVPFLTHRPSLVCVKWRREQHAHSRSALECARQEASIAVFSESLPRAASVTLHMCWHQGLGHDYPPEVMPAADRLRQQHLGGGDSDDNYTSVTFAPSASDLRDVMLLVPYCDLAYITDMAGTVLSEVTGDQG